MNKMPHVPTSDISRRLYRLCTLLFNDYFNEKFMSCRKRLKEQGKTSEDIWEMYKHQTLAFIDLISENIHDKEHVKNLSRIAEPEIVYLCKVAIDHSVEIIDAHKNTWKDLITESDNPFFKTFASLSLCMI